MEEVSPDKRVTLLFDGWGVDFEQSFRKRKLCRRGISHYFVAVR